MRNTPPHRGQVGALIERFGASYLIWIKVVDQEVD
jgi:hypothetical protein